LLLPSKGEVLNCRHLLPDNCLLLTAIGVFRQHERMLLASCGGEPLGLGNLCSAAQGVITAEAQQVGQHALAGAMGFGWDLLKVMASD
jgi:hypothetical protein